MNDGGCIVSVLRRLVYVFMRLPDGYCPLTESTVRLERFIYGVKQADKQWSLLFNKTPTEDAGMTKGKADPWIYKQVEKGRVCECVTFFVPVDDVFRGRDKWGG